MPVTGSKLGLISAVALVAIATASLFANAQQSPATQPDTLILAGKLLADPASGKVLAQQSILVRNGRIVSISSGYAKPANGAKIVDLKNAFVLPGAHVGVTVGLMDLAANDDQLAAVIGHEAAHVVARHAAERQSQSAASRVLLAGAEAAAGESSQLGRGLKAYGDDASLLAFLLPFSRKHELEADRLGVDYMQRAGYRPREAVALWRKMQAQGASGAPQFLSTHPSDGVRIAALEAYLSSRGW